MKSLALIAVVFALLTAACGGDGKNVPYSDVVGSVPWSSSESAGYVLKTKGGQVVGHTILGVTTAGANTELSQAFSGTNASDISTIVVDPKTLKPLTATRRIKNSKDDTELQVTYSKEGALIKDGDKQSGISVPEHAYDNDASLFIWRTLAFSDGYEAKYVTIITNRRTRQDVKLKVRGKETVKVPAGEFTAWRLEIEAEDANQVVWIADNANRTLVRYDNDRGLIFELEKAP